MTEPNNENTDPTDNTDGAAHTDDTGSESTDSASTDSAAKKEQEDLERLFADFDPDMAAELDKQAKSSTSSDKTGKGSSHSQSQPGGANPFANFEGFDPSMLFGSSFGSMGSLFSGIGADPWQNMRQIAGSTATSAGNENNIDPSERIQYENLARVAELAITSNTSLQLHSGAKTPTIRPATRYEWALATVDAYKGPLSALSNSVSNMVTETLNSGDIDAQAFGSMGLPPDFMKQIVQRVGPVIFSTTGGSAAGRLAHRHFGSYDLPVPRVGANELLVVSANINSFAQEWNMKLEDVWLWVCFHEYLSHGVLTKPHIAKYLDSLIDEYVTGFKADRSSLEVTFGELDGSDPSSMAEMANSLNDPEKLISALQTDAQQRTMDKISNLISVVSGYIDHQMDVLCGPYLAQYSMMSEAIRRRRITGDTSERSLERLLGFTLDQSCYDSGRDFISGVVERADVAELEKLFDSVESLPTPNELQAPGLWLARISL